MASDPLVDKEVEKEIDLGCSGESVFLKEESENLVKSATELDETDRVLPEERVESAANQWIKRCGNPYYWKVVGIAYLVVCLVLAAVYVAIYAEQHGLYGSFYDNLENLGRPLGGELRNGNNPRFVDLPYTEWLSRRWSYHGQNISNWPQLPWRLEMVHQVVAGAVGGLNGVWALTNDSVVFVWELSESEELQVFNVTSYLSVSSSPKTRVARHSNGSVFVVDATSITHFTCSALRKGSCKILQKMTGLHLGDVTSIAIANNDGSMWIGGSVGLFVARIQTSGGLGPPTKVANVTDPVYSISWRAPLKVVGSSGVPTSTQVGSVDCADPPALVGEGEAINQFVTLEKKTFLFNSSKCILGKSSFHSNGISWNGDDSLFDAWVHKQWLLASHDDHMTLVKPAAHSQTEFGLLVVGAGFKVYFFDGNQWWFEWASRWWDGLGGVVDGPVTSLSFAPNGDLFLANNVSLSVLSVNYTFYRLGPLQGLPVGNITALSFVPFKVNYPDPFGRAVDYSDTGSIVMATTQGIAIYDLDSAKFINYFYGRRWLPGNRIITVTSLGSDSFLAIAIGGWALLSAENWTLAEKAVYYQTVLPRHTRTPGIVADCPLVNFDPLTCAPYTTDNDGLWTSWLVAAEAFRYKVNRNESARNNAWALFKGMEFLNKVTGVKGLMARSVVRDTVKVSGGTWHNSSYYKGWKWKGDTSSDEVVGHMFALSIAYDLIAESIEEKDQVFQLIDDIVGYIKRNGYYLVDVTGRPTRWGVWAPEQLNWNQSWADEHGLNSLQILTYLLSAYRITNNKDYLNGWLNLYNGTSNNLANHYGLNIINQKITFPRDDNFSDDELAFLPYFTYLYSIKLLAQKDPVLASELMGSVKLSLDATWRTVRKGRSSAWTAIYLFAKGNNTEMIADIVWNLRTWPLELVQWETQNSHRLDIHFNPEQDRDDHSHSQSVHVLPANERGQLRWNGNPFQLDSGAASSEMDPGPWLMPYWLARYINIL